MPDIQTEMSKLLNQWNKPETTMTQPPIKTDKRVTTNVSRELFEHIKLYPGQTIKHVVLGLNKRGFKVASTTSLISQFCRKGLIRKDDDKLYAIAPEYKSGYRKKPKKAMAKPKAKLNGKLLPDLRTVLAQRIETGAPLTGSRPRPAQPSAIITRHVDFDPKKMIGTLSVYHAKALYEELKSMFGG